MRSYIDFDITTNWPIDIVELQIPGVSEAERYLAKHLPQVLVAAKKGNAAIIRRFGAGLPDLPDTGYRAMVICLARVALRHGTLSDWHYHYHNEVHSLDVLEHLLVLTQYQPTGQPNNSGLHQLGPWSCLCLSLFAAAHDIWQTKSGYSPVGIGYNEHASAEETMRILVAIGLDQRRHQPLFQMLRWMIYGSTFFTGPMEFDDATLPPGALAPLVAKQIVTAGMPVGKFNAAQAAELVLLATDIDTGNVAEPIEQYARQSVRMCREAHRGINLTQTDQTSSQSVLRFLTSNQEQYFFNQQRFYSQIARAALSEAKQETGELLKQLVDWLRSRYTDGADQIDALPVGEIIMNDFLDKAAQLGRRPTRHADANQ